MVVICTPDDCVTVVVVAVICADAIKNVITTTLLPAHFPHRRNLRPEQIDYLVAGHGSSAGTFTSNGNVRIICIGTAEVLNVSVLNDLKIWRASAGSFGSDLNRLYDTLGQEATEEMNLCVYDNRLHSAHLPDFIIEDENKGSFRSGVYSVPTLFWRTYLNDHVSKTTGRRIPCGTREQLVFKCKDVRSKPNRLEMLALCPLPRLNVDVASRENIAHRHVVEPHQAKTVIDSNHSFFSNIVTTGSVVTPDPHYYTSFEGNSTRLSNIVSSILTDHPQPHVIVTILVAACGRGRCSLRGVPLGKYVKPTYH